MAPTWPTERQWAAVTGVVGAGTDGLNPARGEVDEVATFAMPLPADYIGTNTRQEKAVTVSDNDETVKFIKKGM